MKIYIDQFQDSIEIFSSYNEDLKVYYNNLACGFYDKTNRRWRFEITKMLEIIKYFNELKYEIFINDKSKYKREDYYNDIAHLKKKILKK